MPYERTRNLDPQFVELVAPLLPPTENDDGPLNIAGMRKAMEHMKAGKDRALSGPWKHLLTGVTIQNIHISMRDGQDVEIRVFAPAGTRSGNLPVVYSCHGGAFVAGSNDTEDLINRQLVYECKVVVFSIDYRLCPEHPVIPVIYNDVEDGLKWVYQNAAKYGGDVSHGLFVSGTSVGGLLVSAMASRSSSLGIPILGAVMRQPAMMDANAAKDEWKPQLKSMEENADAPLLNAQTCLKSSEIWKIPEDKLQDPAYFPIFASREELAKFPRTYIVGAGVDPCIDEVLLFKKFLDEAGVENKLKVYKGLPHGFHSFHMLKAASAEMKETAEGLSWLLRCSEA